MDTHICLSAKQWDLEACAWCEGNQPLTLFECDWLMKGAAVMMVVHQWFRPPTLPRSSPERSSSSAFTLFTGSVVHELGMVQVAAEPGLDEG